MPAQKALWLPNIGARFVLGKNDVPEPGPGQVLVKLEASALNLLDIKIQESGFFEIEEYPIILGEEGTGVVLKVGDGVTHLVQGDQIFFQTSLGNKTSSFQEYCLVVAKLASKVPPNLSFDQVASIWVAFCPFAVATYAQEPEGMALTPPFEPGGLGKYTGQPIVILGGASSVGQQAIQLAHLSGFSPIVTTASLHNQELLLSLGATHVLDRHLPSAALTKHIRQLAHPLTYVFDAVSIRETQQLAYDLLESHGTVVVVKQPQIREDGNGKRVLFVIGSFHPPPNRALGTKFAVVLTTWLETGKIKPNHVEVLPAGLNSIVGGLKRLKAGVSATKLVVCPPETIEQSNYVC